MSQKIKVLNFMKTHGGITTAQAFGFGCCRLSERIRELERDGYPINRTWIEFTSDDGRPGRCVRYSLRETDTHTQHKTERKGKDERISL